MLQVLVGLREVMPCRCHVLGAEILRSSCAEPRDLFEICCTPSVEGVET